MFTTKRDFVVSNGSIGLSDIRPSDHEKTDNRVRLHMRHTVMDGHQKAFLRTVDTQIHIWHSTLGRRRGGVLGWTLLKQMKLWST